MKKKGKLEKIFCHAGHELREIHDKKNMLPKIKAKKLLKGVY